MATTITTAAAPPLPPPPPVNLADFAAVKRALDDAVAEAVLAEGGGGGEDGRVYWGKIAIGVVSIAVALLAQFYPGKPPATTPLLFACVGVYAALSAALSAIAVAVEKDAFLFVKAGRARPALAVASKMARFEPGYELAVEERRGGGKGGNPRGAAASLQATSFFHADGKLAKAAVAAAVGRLLAEFDRTGKQE